MKFQFFWVGKAKNEHYKALQDDYLKRLSHFVRCDVTEFRDGHGNDKKECEGKRILAKVNHSSFVCLLDEKGKGLTSEELALEVEKWQNAGRKEIVFIIGGSDGTAAEIAGRADFMLSLSFLTFTHEMARVVMLEQLYRAHTIIKGFPYQK